MQPVILWLRRDLRLRDNTALQAALDSGTPIMPLFIFDPMLLQGERFSAARLKFMLAGLEALAADLRAMGRNLLVRHGDPLTVLVDLVSTTNAAALYFNRDYSPYAIKRDSGLAATLGIPVYAYDDALLHPPDAVLKADGDPYVVYTPFKRAWLALPKPDVLHYDLTAEHFHDLRDLDQPPIPSLRDLGVNDTIDVPPAGASSAQDRLDAFMSAGVYTYVDQRNQLTINPFTDANAGTSALSPYFRFGMISPRQAYAAAMSAKSRADNAAHAQSVDVWISEIAWREFYMHILNHFPHVLKRSFRPEYDQVEWHKDADDLAAWQAGQTGYPVVDAAMRQLLTIGWMHNRARMIVASFLTKDLLIYWRAGDLHFMRHLIDGDPAANNGGWQWSAGTGTDAQPYFRIFNPVSQSEQFDPTGAYIRHFVPELRDVPDEYIHAPWTMPTPPPDYPAPIIDHKFARARALAAFKAAKG